MSDANYTALRYVSEAAYGVTPTPARLTNLRFTGESLEHAKETVVSNEIRSDRQRADLIQVGAMGQGGINFEFSRDEYLPFILAMLGATDWVTINLTVTATSAVLGQTLTATAGAFDDVLVGGFVRLAGFPTAGNNGIKRVVSKNNDGSVLTFAPGTFTAGDAGATVVITGRDARNGIAKKTFTLEREILAPDNKKYFQGYTGMAVNEFSLDVVSKAIVTGSFGFMGKRGLPAYTSRNNTAGAFASGTLTAGATDANDGDIITVGTRVYTLKTALTGAVDEIKLDSTPATLAVNIRKALAADAATLGTLHGALTANDDITADADSDASIAVTARRMGTAANAIVTTTTASTGELDWGAATLAGGAEATAPYAATTNPVMNGVNNVGQIFQGTTQATERFKSVNLKVTNNIRSKDAIGELGAFELGWGTIDVTGSISAYFRNNKLYEQLVNHEYSGIAYVLTDAAGKSFAVTLPYVNFGKGDPKATAINTDIMLDTDFTAIMHPTYLCSIIINPID